MFEQPIPIENTADAWLPLITIGDAETQIRLGFTSDVGLVGDCVVASVELELVVVDPPSVVLVSPEVVADPPLAGVDELPLPSPFPAEVEDEPSPPGLGLSTAGCDAACDAPLPSLGDEVASFAPVAVVPCSADVVAVAESPSVLGDEVSPAGAEDESDEEGEGVGDAVGAAWAAEASPVVEAPVAPPESPACAVAAQLASATATPHAARTRRNLFMIHPSGMPPRPQRRGFFTTSL